MTDVTANGDLRRMELSTTLRDASKGDQAGEDLVYSLDEAAKLLRIGRTSLYELLAAEELKSIKIGSRRLIARGDIEAFVESRRSERGAA